MAQSPFNHLFHADWSIHPASRWVVEAARQNGGWLVDAPRPVGPVAEFVRKLLDVGRPTLAGFDFPIGVPASFGQKTGLGSFCDAVEQFGLGSWSRFYQVSETAEDISLYRPFYPRVSSRVARQAHLLAALDVASIDDLRRDCDLATEDRRAACPLFWTLGPSQVGKAAISGWREVLQPARRAGAMLWPFDGHLPSLAEQGGLVICETYPAEAYRHVGVRFLVGGSKRRQLDRSVAMMGLTGRCRAIGIEFTTAMSAAVANAFGAGNNGEDQFDATLGALAMIEVVEGRRAPTPVVLRAPEWEGWILGQASPGDRLARALHRRPEAVANPT